MPRPAHRPPMVLDEKLIEILSEMMCPVVEIAAYVGCSVDTLDRRYAELMAKGRDKGRTKLRRFQWEAASKGNVVMLIWLGKQYLGQKDNEVKLDTPQKTITLKYCIEDKKQEPNA